MKRIVCLLLCLLIFTGCTPTSNPLPPAGELLVGPKPLESQTGEEAKQKLTLIYYPKKTMNPYDCTDYTNRALFSLLYQGLFSTDRNYKVEPVLCKSYSVSKDNKTYTFYLEDAAFSDAQPVTAQDVVASLKQAKESKVYGGRFTHFSSIGLSDDGGVKIKLKIPMDNLPLLLDIPIVKESEVSAFQPLGTGPYMLDSSGMSPRLRRTSWWCEADLVVDLAAIDLMEAPASNNAQTIIKDYFQYEGLDLVCVNPYSGVDYLADHELWDMENGNFLYLACSEDSKVLHDSGLRKYLTYAIDRELLAQGKEYYKGFARAATLPASPRFPHYNLALAERYSYDPEKFAAAVQDCGVAGKTVKLLVNDKDAPRLRAARAIKQMLEAGGLVVTISEKNGSAYTAAVKNRSYDLYLGQTQLSPNMDLSPFFYTNGTLSYGGVDDVSAYTFSKEALANYGNYYTLHALVMDEGLLTPILFQSYGIYANRGQITALTPSRDNVFYYSTGRTLEDALIKP